MQYFKFAINTSTCCFDVVRHCLAIRCECAYVCEGSKINNSTSSGFSLVDIGWSVHYYKKRFSIGSFLDNKNTSLEARQSYYTNIEHSI